MTRWQKSLSSLRWTPTTWRRPIKETSGKTTVIFWYRQAAKISNSATMGIMLLVYKLGTTEYLPFDWGIPDNHFDYNVPQKSDICAIEQFVGSRFQDCITWRACVAWNIRGIQRHYSRQSLRLRCAEEEWHFAFLISLLGALGLSYEILSPGRPVLLEKYALLQKLE